MEWDVLPAGIVANDRSQSPLRSMFLSAALRVRRLLRWLLAVGAARRAAGMKAKSRVVVKSIFLDLRSFAKVSK